MIPSEDNKISDYYFDSYAHFGIHQEMLSDKNRTLSYKTAILKNPSLFQGKIVLDVGCGSGILSLFAAKAGAKKVYGIEKSSIGEYAQKIVKLNGFEGIIEIIRGSMEEINLPEKVDVIISEWMGYCLLYESMLPSVIFARNKYMKQGGCMFPSRAQMFICAIEDEEYSKRKFHFWDDVLGFNLEPIKKWAYLEPLVEICPPGQIVTDECKLIDLDLNFCNASDLSFEVPFNLHVLDSQTINAFVIYFTVLFEGPENTVLLTTSPLEQPTHWCQSLFYLQTPLQASIDDTITGTFSVKPNDRNIRDQDFTLTWSTNGSDKISQNYRMR